jgi:intraflagellar transport protein 172
VCDEQANDLVYGLAEGKVKVGQLRSNKPATLYSTDSYVTALAANTEGTAIVSAHVDGSVYRFIFEDGQGGAPSHALFANHPCPPFALAWGQAVLVAGNDSTVVMYDQYGGVERTFDYGTDPKCKEFTAAAFNPSGETAVVGNYNRFYVFALDPRTGGWEEAGVKEVDNLYSVSALDWKPDGSRLALGSVCGVLDLYDACIKRCRYKGKFEFTYVSLSQVIVRRLASGARNMIKSAFGCEISKIHIFQDRFVVAHTSETLLLGDLETFKLSEVQWHGSGSEKFVLDNPAVAIVYYAGELSIIEYGQNEVSRGRPTYRLAGSRCAVKHVLVFILIKRWSGLGLIASGSLCNRCWGLCARTTSRATC